MWWLVVVGGGRVTAEPSEGDHCATDQRDELLNLARMGCARATTPADRLCFGQCFFRARVGNLVGLFGMLLAGLAFDQDRTQPRKPPSQMTVLNAIQACRHRAPQTPALEQARNT